MLNQLIAELQALRDPEKAKVLQGFFKTGKGEYGEGDVFWGITVPIQRSVAKKFGDLSLTDIEKLLASDVHEQRLVGLLILVSQFEKADKELRRDIFSFYLQHIDRVNNWDLVDLTAPKIVGKFLLDQPREVLYQMAKSQHLWTRRVAVLASFAFIADKQFEDAFRLCEILLGDSQDLMHKACGWMLREIGKRDERVLEGFLRKNISRMPRTMLRYAIERMEEGKRKAWFGR